MTIVEFFDKTAIENLVTTLICKPDKVIFIGDNGKSMAKHIYLYDEIVTERGQMVEFSFRTVNRNNLNNIVEVLTQIVEENEKCIFDLTGGEDLYLVAVGIVSKKYDEKTQLYRFNIRNNTIIDCEEDGGLTNETEMEVSVRENIRIYSGKIVETFTDGFEWDFNEDFCSDVDLMWAICKEDSKRWNRLGFVLTSFGEACFDDNSQRVLINKDTAGDIWRTKAEDLDKSFLKRLAGVDLIRNLKIFFDGIYFEFKNEQIKRSITKAGQVLELYITMIARELTDKNGEKIYNDVQTGVLIDWDGLENTGIESLRDFATMNEVDLILMKGMIPVFVSCKNGMVDVDELYKLSVVASRFGGKYAKKVLLVSDLDASNPNHRYLCARAEDMNIRLIDNVSDISEKELKRMLASLWCN